MKDILNLLCFLCGCSLDEVRMDISVIQKSIPIAKQEEIVG